MLKMKKNDNALSQVFIGAVFMPGPFSVDPASGHWYLSRIRHSLAFEPLPIRLCLTGFAHYNEIGV